MENEGGKVRYFLLMIIPTISFFAIQVAVSMVFAVIVSVIAGLQMAKSGASSSEIIDRAMADLSSQSGSMIFFAHLASVILFFLWYYHCFGKKKKHTEKTAGGVGIFGCILVLGIFSNLFCQGMLDIEKLCFPGAYDTYVEMMESSQIGMNVLASVAAIFLAPIGEELVFRGLTVKYGMKVFRRFWIVNLIQAFLFGLMHMNLIQGMYAFALGLILGEVVCLTKSVLPAIFLHFVNNFIGVLMGEGIVDFLGKYISQTLAAVIVMVVFGLGVGIILYVIKKMSVNDISLHGQG